MQVSSCKTWTGKGDATEGELIPAADLTFTIDTDPATGQETISVTELKQARRQGDVTGPDTMLGLDPLPSCDTWHAVAGAVTCSVGVDAGHWRFHFESNQLI